MVIILFSLEIDKRLNFRMYKLREGYKMLNQNHSETIQKKINFLKGLGFKLTVEGTYVSETSDTDLIAKHLDDVTATRVLSVPEATNLLFIYCRCSRMYKLLNLPTLSVFLDGELQDYIVGFSNLTYNQLKDCSNIQLFEHPEQYEYKFDARHMPVVEVPKGKKYTLYNVPVLHQNQIEKIKRIDALLTANEGLHFQINTGSKYRIAPLILDFLSHPLLSVNERRVLERVLLAITNSTFVIDAEVGLPFVISFKKFTKDLHLSRSTEKKEDLIASALDTLCKYSLLESYHIDAETGMITFEAVELAQQIKKQNFQRKIGFYDAVPKTKQASVIASFLDHLFLIDAYKLKQKQPKRIKSGLETLLQMLHQINLLEQHRLTLIAKLLTTLSIAGHNYGFLTEAHAFSSEEVKKLLKKEEALSKYMEIAKRGEATKEGIENV